jgi:aryl-alcohol dehydrogenase-like predicted oxidoreductase
VTRFGDLLRTLAAADVDFILVGGVAAAAHGSPRSTQDLDVIYSREDRNLERLVEAILPYHPYLRGAPPGLPFRLDFETLRAGLNFTLVTELGWLDLLGEIVGGGTYEDLLSHSITVEAFGSSCRVLDLETLIRPKKMAGRPKTSKRSWSWSLCASAWKDKRTTLWSWLSRGNRQHPYHRGVTPDHIQFRQLGAAGPRVFPLALGCMGMSGMYGHADENESIATIHAALDRGVTLLDTGDFYGMGHNEMLIGRALKGHRDRVLLSVKFGALRGPDGAWLGFDGRPASVKNFLAHTLTRLGTDHIDIYRPSRLDHSVPIEETIGAIADLVKAGYVRAIGLSEVGPQTIRRAHAIHPITDLQIEYSLISRGPEARIFPAIEELGIAVTAYGILSRGLLSGSLPADKGDLRAHLPRFQGESLTRNWHLVDTLKNLAAEQGLRPSQLAIAWVLAKNPNIVAVIGARTRPQLGESLDALKVQLSPADVVRIEEAVPASAVAGTRYDERQMKMLDSEK